MNLHAEDSINDTLHILTEYKEFFTQIKNQVRSSRLQAALAVNSEVIKLYWYIGNEILKRQQATNWGSKRKLPLKVHTSKLENQAAIFSL